MGVQENAVLSGPNALPDVHTWKEREWAPDLVEGDAAQIPRTLDDYLAVAE